MKSMLRFPFKLGQTAYRSEKYIAEEAYSSKCDWNMFV